MNSMIRTIAWHEYVVNVRRPGFIFATLLIPALGLIGLIIATFFSGEAAGFFREQFGGSERVVGVVDRSGLYAPIPAQFAGDFTGFADEAAARAALLDERIAAYVVIPADFVDSGAVTAYSPGGFGGTIALDSDTLDPFLIHGLLAGRVDAGVLRRASDPADLTIVTLDDAGQPTSGTDSPLAFVGGFIASIAVSLLLFISIMISSNYLLRSVSEEKESRVMEVLISSVDALDLLWGKVLGLGALGLTQVGVWLLSAVVLTGGLPGMALGALAALSPGVLGLALVYFVLGFLLYSILMAAAGSLGTSMRESQQIGGLFSFSAAVPWMINGFLFANPNFILARLLSWFPLTAPMMMMLRLPYGETPLIDVVGSIAVLVVSVPVVMWAGVKVFRTSLLIYGKRLSVRELAAVLRRA